MKLTSIRDGVTTRDVDGYFARAVLPLRLEPAEAEARLVAPLAQAMDLAGLGRISAMGIEPDASGEPAQLTLDFSLPGDGPDILKSLARILDDLGAPKGSVIGNAECPDLLTFGTAQGLGLYLDRADLGPTGADHRDVVRACQRALKGAGVYRGAFSTSDRTALYFYGHSFQNMQSAITYVMSTNPKCRNAFARKLN